MRCFLAFRSSPSSRVSPSRNSNNDILKFTPASGPSIDEAYTLKPGVIGPRNLMSVSNPRPSKLVTEQLLFLLTGIC